MSSPTTYLITGANRGLGKELVTHYLSKPNTVVIGAVRDPFHPTSLALTSLPHHETSKLVTIKIDSSITADPSTAISTLKTDHDIQSLDVIVPVAGIAKLALLKDLEVAELQEHIDINAVTVLRLFQASLPLLKASTKKPRFVLIGASAGSFGMMATYPFPNTSYSVSKIMVQWMVRKMHMEEEWLVAFSIHPGWVQTDMGNEGARSVGMEKAAVTIEGSITGLVQAINNADRETGFAPFHDFERNVIPF